MRVFGSLLMAAGILVGVGLAAAIVVGGSAFGVSWIISVAIAKLTFLGSIGLLGAGAVFHRLDRQRKNRELDALSGTSKTPHP